MKKKHNGLAISPRTNGLHGIMNNFEDTWQPNWQIQSNSWSNRQRTF